MHSKLTLGWLAALGLLTAAHPFPAKRLDRRVCHFDEANPLVLARNANIKRQSLELGSTRPAELKVPLDEVWEHTEETRPADLDFENYAYDQIIAGKGKINYCVRWESSNTVSEADRADIETAVQRSFKKWVDVMAGYDGFPYSSVDVNVVGWAVKDKNLLQGSTDGIDVYTATDSEGAPQCDEACGRFFHYQDGDYSGCATGANRHYDLSLWLTDGFEGGAGGDWGQRVGSEYFMDAVNQEDIHIVLHELGHTFGLDDFYDWTPTGMDSFIMLAGSSMVITEFDAWMARDWWTKAIKSRYPNTDPSEEVASSTTAPDSSVAPSSAAYSSVAVSVSSAPASYPPPGISAVPTFTSIVVSAVPTGTGYFSAPGNGTVLPTGSGAFPTGGTAYPTGGPTGNAPCLLGVSPSDVSVAPAATRGPWGHGHRWSNVRFAASPLPRPVKHDWRD